MTAQIFSGIALGVAFFTGGYYVWSFALDKYDSIIFSPGFILRGTASLLCLTLAIMLDFGAASPIALLGVACILWLWTFLSTWTRSNLVLALFSLVYQVSAIFLVLLVIDGLKEGLTS